jgi:hypothetical protein
LAITDWGARTGGGEDDRGLGPEKTSGQWAIVEHAEV